ncbi:MAG: hypothetical protein LBD47_06900 [Treponema sp.]|nr:hypothetical protein [Treponema sp.]
MPGNLFPHLGFGGRFFGRNNLPQFYSESNVRALENLKELKTIPPAHV